MNKALQFFTVNSFKFIAALLCVGILSLQALSGLSHAQHDHEHHEHHQEVEAKHLACGEDSPQESTPEEQHEGSSHEQHHEVDCSLCKLQLVAKNYLLPQADSVSVSSSFIYQLSQNAGVHSFDLILSTASRAPPVIA